MGDPVQERDSRILHMGKRNQGREGNAGFNHARNKGFVFGRFSRDWGPSLQERDTRTWAQGFREGRNEEYSCCSSLKSHMKEQGNE